MLNIFYLCFHKACVVSSGGSGIYDDVSNSLMEYHMNMRYDLKVHSEPAVVINGFQIRGGWSCPEPVHPDTCESN